MPKPMTWHSTRSMNQNVQQFSQHKKSQIRLGFVPLAHCAAIAVACETGIFDKFGLNFVKPGACFLGCIEKSSMLQLYLLRKAHERLSLSR
jgi:hypothetical protein